MRFNPGKNIITLIVYYKSAWHAVKATCIIRVDDDKAYVTSITTRNKAVSKMIYKASYATLEDYALILKPLNDNEPISVIRVL